MPSIGIVHNPNAQRNKKDKEIGERLKAVVGRFGWVRETKNVEETSEVAKEFLHKGIEILGINGGDGTIHCTLSKFIQVYGKESLPPLLHLRGGTMNTVANSLGLIRGPAEKILARMMEKYRRNGHLEIAEREVIQVGERYGFIFGSGFATNFLEAYYQGSEPGPRKVLKMLARLIVERSAKNGYSERLFAPTRARILVEEEELPWRDFTVICASTVRHAGLGFQPTYRAGEKEGYFHFLGSPGSAQELLPNIIRIYRGLPLKGVSVYDNIARAAKIYPEGELKYTIDGDIYRSTQSLTIKIGPRLKIIRGSPLFS